MSNHEFQDRGNRQSLFVEQFKVASYLAVCTLCSGLGLSSDGDNGAPLIPTHCTLFGPCDRRLTLVEYPSMISLGTFFGHPLLNFAG